MAPARRQRNVRKTAEVFGNSVGATFLGCAGRGRGELGGAVLARSRLREGAGTLGVTGLGKVRVWVPTECGAKGCTTYAWGKF